MGSRMTKNFFRYFENNRGADLNSVPRLFYLYRSTQTGVEMIPSHITILNNLMISISQTWPFIAFFAYPASASIFYAISLQNNAFGIKRKRRENNESEVT